MKITRIFLIVCLLVPVAFFSLVLPVPAAAPVLQSQLDNFNKMVGTRVETVAILDGEDGISGGFYNFDTNGSTLSITKFGGRGTPGEPKPIGDTGLRWLPLLGGCIGYSEAKNNFSDTPLLVGNDEKYASYAIGIEAGVRILLTDTFSIGPTFGMIYSQTKSSFHAVTPAGIELKRQYDRHLVDWYVDTVSFVPSVDVQYKKKFAEKWILTLTSRYSWFKTRDIATSSNYIRISGNSSYWDNNADLDVRLPLKMFGFPLHTGYSVSAGILGDDLRAGLDSSAVYTLGGRLVVGDMKGRWMLGWAGIGISYVKSNVFSGLSWGLSMSFAP
ncbi:MAG: hypothetical protein HPY65_15460 [Syntrophaceae bacterium]|nr:hypothetical protein [Syntrophaceae bacterium]